MSDSPEQPASKDALGLDLDSLKVSEDNAKADSEQADTNDVPTTDASAAAESPESEKAAHTDQTDASEATSPTTDDKKPPPRERRKPYVNPERVRTGGTQREKLSEEELAQRMVRIREQNEKIKLRRLDVDADEREFKKTQEKERMKLLRNKKVQADVDRARQQNVQRKLEKIQNREWDSGKPGVKRAEAPEPTNPANRPPAPTANIGIRGAIRGGGTGRGRGRGGGGPPSHAAPAAATSPPAVPTKPTESPAATAS